jgi:hypothetical protein
MHKALTLLSAAALLASAGSASAAAPLKLSATPTTTEAGRPVLVKYSVKRPPAKLVLRLDGKTLKTLKVRKGRGRVTVNLPRSLAPGSHRLSACVKRTCKSVSLKVIKHPSTTPPHPSPAPPTTETPEPVPQPAPGPEPEPIDFTGKPNPLDVQAETDAAHRATKTIDVDGGTLETTDADGTHYKLTVPSGALLSAERISMSPISSVGGLPYAGGLAAGVQLEPSGLRFTKLVTVEITNHPPVSAQEETGFLYQHDGVEFQLYPVREDDSKTTFNILHFSGVGIARGTEAERNAQLLRTTTDVEGRLMQQFAALFRPGEDIDLDRAKGILRAFHDQSVKPLVTAALSDDGLATQALNRYFGWERYIQLLLADNEFMAAERAVLADQFAGILKNAAIQAHKRCVDESRPEELPTILAWWRQLALLGKADEMPAELWTAISSCARFEVDFHTKITQEQERNEEGPEVWKGEAIAENVIIEPDPLTLQQSGTKDAQYVDFRVDIPPHKPGTGCWYGGDEWETTFPLRVTRLEIDLNPVQRPDGSYGHPAFERGKIKLSISPFLTHEQVYVADCNGTGEPSDFPWLGPTFFELHQDQFDHFGGIVITDWTTPGTGSSLLGTKTYSRTESLSGYPTHEETTIQLYHAPVR